MEINDVKYYFAHPITIEKLKKTQIFEFEDVVTQAKKFLLGTYQVGNISGIPVFASEFVSEGEIYVAKQNMDNVVSKCIFNNKE